MKVGSKILNIHTMLDYTIVGIETVKVDSENYITVYTVANDKFESHRFDSSYLLHYALVDEEE
jgi:hypothetical protein